MLINPAAIVAFLLYLVVGPLTFSRQFQTRFKSLGHGVHHKISSVFSLPHGSFEPQDYPAVFAAATAEAFSATPVEITTVRLAEALPSCPILFEDRVEVVIPEVCPTHYDNNTYPAPALVFVESSGYQRSFHWRDLFTLQVFGVLSIIYISVWFPLVVVPLVAKLLWQSKSPEEPKQPVEAQPILLPTKVLTPPRTVNIRILDPKRHAPLEPIFTPAHSAHSPFWLVSEQQQQDRPSPPSPPLLQLLGFFALENDPEKKLSPLSSPADSGYGTTLPDTASDASPIVSGKSITTPPEHLAESSPTAGAELTFVHGLNDVTTSKHVTDETDTAGFDTEPEDDDDDGSTTVTNSIANLAEQTTPILAEDLVTKLESITAALIEEQDESFPPAKGPSITPPPSDNAAADPPSHDEPIAGSGITDPITGPACVDQKTTTGTGLEIVVEEDETSVGDDLPSQDDPEQGVEPWIPHGKIPTIVISPPSEADPEDYTQQLDWEEEQEEPEDTLDSSFEGDLEPEDEGSECDSDSELEYPGDYPVRPVIEVDSELPPSPVEAKSDRCHSPYQSPIITGMVWADNEDEDVGPLPFTDEVIHVEETDNLEVDTPEPSDTAEIAEQPEAADVLEETEAQVFTIEGGALETVTATSKDANVEEPVVEGVRELVEEPQPASEMPRQAATKPVPTAPVPSPSRPRYPIRTQAPLNGEDRGEGSSRGCRKLELSRPKYFHCCKLYKSDGRPESWNDWKFEKPEACIPMKTNLQEWQFVRPTDEDGKNPTTRIAIDNLDADWFRMTGGIPSYNYLTEAMGFFTTKYFRCWRSRTIDGVEYPSIGYATVDFDSLDEAIRMFEELQGRRLRGHTWHWRLEFVDPRDNTHGGRKIIRTSLVPDSVKQALAAELEASTRRHGKSGHSSDSGADTAVVARPPARVRPRLSVGGRSLLAGAMANVVQVRRTEEQPAQSTTRVPPRRPYRSRS